MRLPIRHASTELSTNPQTVSLSIVHEWIKAKREQGEYPQEDPPAPTFEPITHRRLPLRHRQSLLRRDRRRIGPEEVSSMMLICMPDHPL